MWDKYHSRHLRLRFWPSQSGNSTETPKFAYSLQAMLETWGLKCFNENRQGEAAEMPGWFWEGSYRAHIFSTSLNLQWMADILAGHCIWKVKSIPQFHICWGFLCCPAFHKSKIWQFVCDPRLAKWETYRLAASTTQGEMFPTGETMSEWTNMLLGRRVRRRRRWVGRLIVS